MRTIHINEAELCCLGLFRMVLSESSQESRERAIEVMRHEVVSLGLENFPIRKGKTGSLANRPEFVQWVAETSRERYEAAHEYSEITRRYEDQNERRLNVAEQIGKMVWLSIQDGKYEGVQTDYGILYQVSEQARELKFRGAKSTDTLREIWKTYRGVVHLGMALDFCEDHPSSRINPLKLAEQYRRDLGENCPRGQTQPYIPPNEQISFLYIS